MSVCPSDLCRQYHQDYFAAVEQQMQHDKLAVKHHDRGFCVNAAMS